MASPVQPQFAKPQPRPRPGQGVPGGAPAAAGQPPAQPRPPAPAPAAPAPTPTPRPQPTPGLPAQQVTSPPPVAPYAAQAQQRASSAYANAQEAPDRVALAKSSLEQFTKDQEPGFQQSLRAVGQNAAKFGRIGAGMTTNELTDVGLARQRTLDSEASRLATDAAGKTMDDRLALSRDALDQFKAYSGADSEANKLALDSELGRGKLSLDSELGRGDLNIKQGDLNLKGELGRADVNLGRDRLGLDTTREANDVRLREADTALKGELGRGDLKLGQDKLGEDTRQFNRSDEFRQSQADRDFLLDDRVAEAMAALDGYDVTGTAVDPAQKEQAIAKLSPEEQDRLANLRSQGVA